MKKNTTEMIIIVCSIMGICFFLWWSENSCRKELAYTRDVLAQTQDALVETQESVLFYKSILGEIGESNESY
ncbi:MAG: hypothetical protein PF440_11735 [Thiomicrorhabdus sp.]|jgi:hypothetical protein|nr:hypothetical protein [Thiomicrorhabdus sp.]